jgi:aspartokinase
VGVNVIAIAQGSSERNISFCVNEADQAKAVRAIHEEFEASPGAPAASGAGQRTAVAR